MTRLTEKGIQLSPPGLLNLLQLKTGGINPDDLQREVTPSIDLEAWWLRAAIKTVQGSYAQAFGAATYQAIVSPLGPGLVNFGPGPRNWWYVHHCSILAAVSNGFFNNTSFAMRNLGASGLGTDSFLSLSDAVASFGNAAGDAWLTFSAHDFWMPPNSTVGLFVSQTTGPGSITLAGCSYTELPV